MLHGVIQSQKANIKNVHDYPVKKINYTTPYFGFRDVQATGKYVRLAIIDSGVPVHKDIAVDVYKSSTSGATRSVIARKFRSSGIAGLITSGLSMALISRKRFIVWLFVLSSKPSVPREIELLRRRMIVNVALVIIIFFTQCLLIGFC
jgi:hypothetical protein